ncbi:hypothetical protein KXD40_005704 [Peronospora effusa]|uniref:Uncharacterized protein n=1 Tax=Peronospora effusa TaxID=542832 RepID=A0A3M6VED5_9STRA|nr:hypothetical protein DD238_003672 [Peronospora effusa]RQM15590.1 hypothetical protein DD237_003510 [Peronospora effusa]UIZ27482.1 hypothetical protein KXD40_005704 [Peronospora effusa]
MLCRDCCREIIAAMANTEDKYICPLCAGRSDTFMTNTCMSFVRSMIFSRSRSQVTLQGYV